MNAPPPIPTDTSAVSIDPHVKITLHDIYGALLGVQADVAEIKSTSRSITDHETRIRSLEKWVWGAAGLGAGGGAALSQIITALMR